MRAIHGGGGGSGLGGWWCRGGCGVISHAHRCRNDNLTWLSMFVACVSARAFWLVCARTERTLVQSEVGPTLAGCQTQQVEVVKGSDTNVGAQC